VGSFGEHLRREREMRGITLEEIAAATKIGTRSLKALEDEDFKKLPGGIFNKGFVRAYAKFLGIDEEQAVADFVAASGDFDTIKSNIDPAQLLGQHEEVKKSSSKKAKDLQSIQTDSRSGFPWIAIFGLILLVAVAYGGRFGYVKYKAHEEAQAQAQRDAQARVEAEAAAARAASEAAAQAAAAQSVEQPAADVQSQQTPATPDSSGKASQQTAQPAAAEATNANLIPGGFTVSVRARQRTWISIISDGKRVISEELPPASEKVVQAHDRITLRTGNAGGMDLALNGKAMPSLGAEGEARTVTIGANGLIQ